MSSLRADMFGRQWICLIQGRIYLVNQDNEQQKCRLGTKTMNLGPDKITTSEQDTIEHIEIDRATRCNLFTRNHT
jgi:hypothetical protein